MEKNEKYSVLIAVYRNDNPDYFRQSLNSMVAQSIKPDEIVIVLDGPITKDLQQVISNVKASCAQIEINEIKLEKNIGLGAALKIGVQKCRNELIARMDSDDISLPDRCSLQLSAFRENPKLDIVGFSVQEFSGNVKNIVGERRVPESNDAIYKFARLRDPFNHPTVMFRKSKVLSVGNYGDYRKNQDTDLWIKLLLNGAVCCNLPGSHFFFRFDEVTYAKRKNWLNTKILLCIRYRAWRKGYNSFMEFLIICIGQVLRFFLPIVLQKKIYLFMKK